MELPPQTAYVGTAGWSLPAVHAAHFPEAGTHLTRYAGRFTGVEINSSFHRPHSISTYARWAEAVPENFRFAVKVPKEITHKHKLVETTEPLERFLRDISGLGEKMGPLLVQLPPGLGFESPVAEDFFATLRARFTGRVACEPRHPDWFSDEAEDVLKGLEIARVAADPARVPEAALPGGWPGLVYYRLHGSPRMYYSAYSDGSLATLAGKLRETLNSATVWCIFDNTVLGAAAGDAIETVNLLT